MIKIPEYAVPAVKKASEPRDKNYHSNQEPHAMNKHSGNAAIFDPMLQREIRKLDERDKIK